MEMVLLYKSPSRVSSLCISPCPQRLSDTDSTFASGLAATGIALFLHLAPHESPFKDKTYFQKLLMFDPVGLILFLPCMVCLFVALEVC